MRVFYFLKANRLIHSWFNVKIYYLLECPSMFVFAKFFIKEANKKIIYLVLKGSNIQNIRIEKINLVHQTLWIKFL